MFRFERLDIWNEAISFARKMYACTRTFPQIEVFALADQLRRATVSISANIAEGSGSSSSKDFRNYLNISIKSIYEVVSLLAIAKNNEYISEREFQDLREEAERLTKRTRAFRNSLSRDSILQAPSSKLYALSSTP